MTLSANDLNIILPVNHNYALEDEILALIKYDNIFLMSNKCDLSVRNIFKGKITNIRIHKEMFRIRVDIGEVEISCDITKPAYEDLNLKLDKEIYIGFKATSIATLKV
ncbi:MAG: TOBE domain-containing protein [Methanobrevibacter sp.]|jgi:molybdate transport system regulatory protein|nr:TOBE domain-containing protein [Candidatus Methanoflexus mossambicus]